MLFIAMIEAAALAASSASGERCSFASPTIAAMTLRLREASAVATRVPHRCCSLSSVSITRAARLSRWSLAYAGSFSFRASIDIEILREGMRRVVGAASTWPARSSSCRRCMQPRSRHPVRALLLGSPEGLSFPRHAAVDHKRQAGSDRTLTRWPGSDDLINIRLRTVYVASGRARRLTRKLDRFGMIGHRISGDAFGNHILVPYLDRLNGTRWPAVPHQPRRH